MKEIAKAVKMMDRDLFQLGIVHVPDPGGLIRGRLLTPVYTNDAGDAAQSVFSEPLTDRSLGREKTIVLSHHDLFAHRASFTDSLVRIVNIRGERLFRQYRQAGF